MAQKFFAIRPSSSQSRRMVEPLAMVCYERIMPGSQLVNRLQDLNYRVMVIANPALIVAAAQRESPLLLLVDLETGGDVCQAIGLIKSDTTTRHLPVIAFASDTQSELLATAQKSGANLAVGDSLVSGHLPALLQQALQVD
jgi:CheY-like chemotaxis protein